MGMTNSVQNPGANEEAIKSAETALREAVSRLGNQHPEVLSKLVQYIAALRQCGKAEQADKMELRANALRDILVKDGSLAKAEEAAKAAEAARAAEAAEAARAAAAAKAEQDRKALLAQQAAKSKAAAEEGVFDLDAFADEDEDSIALAMELVKETAATVPVRSAPVATAAAPAAPEGEGFSKETGLFLYNSKGEHIAVAYKNGLYTPSGVNLGRLLEDFDVYIDRDGWYLGQIIEGDRLGRDPTWQHRDLNFGNKGNEGDSAGWGRQADTNAYFFDRPFVDVKLEDD